jgi:serine phosphatase RsbU (regulator of sigma subunit)
LRYYSFDRIKRTYRTITDSLTVKELQNLYRKDAPEVYSFYVNRMREPAYTGKTIQDKIRFGRNLFMGFVKQLSPARRIIYIFALYLFIMAYVNDSWFTAIISFGIITLLLAFELANKITYNDELTVAGEIQDSLLPKFPPSNNNYDISCYSETAKSVGGDYYDFVYKEESLVLAVGDISGKGMGAAIHMVQMQALFRHLLVTHSSPKIVLSLLNEDLGNLFQPGTFFTINLALLQPDGIVQFCRAGHLPVIHYSCKSGMCRNITPGGIGIGLCRNGFFESSLEEVSILPDQGDILLFFTDGITEAMNSYLMEYGEERLMRIIKNNAHKTASEIKSAIIGSIKGFTVSAPVNDDLTLVVLKKK